MHCSFINIWPVQVITFTAARDIAAGEELTFFYGSNLWFEEAACEQSSDAQQPTPMHEHMDDEDAFLAAIDV